MKLAAERHVTIPGLLVESALTGSRGETLTQRKKTIVELFKIIVCLLRSRTMSIG